MKDYHEKVVEKFVEEISARVYSPAQHHIFTVNYEDKKPDEESSNV